jgi:hypothetical protein
VLLLLAGELLFLLLATKSRRSS